MDDLRIGVTSFNSDWAMTKTQDEFVKEMSLPGHEHILPEVKGDAERTKSFQDVYQTIKKSFDAQQAKKAPKAIPANEAVSLGAEKK